MLFYRFPGLGLALLLGLWTMCVEATIVILTPSPEVYAVQSQPILISWTANGTLPANVTIKIYNINNVPINGSVVLGVAPTADLSFKTATIDSSWAGDGWFITLEDTVIAGRLYSSSAFSIRPTGTAPAPLPASLTNGTTNGTNLPVTTNGATSTAGGRASDSLLFGGLFLVSMVLAF